MATHVGRVRRLRQVATEDKATNVSKQAIPTGTLLIMSSHLGSAVTKLSTNTLKEAITLTIPNHHLKFISRLDCVSFTLME